MKPGMPLEEVLSFRCEGDLLWGILTRPPAGTPQATFVVVIAVGGPQYRAGSHRQFVHLARSLAQRGVPSLRFDYRGMGDSEGETRTFETVGADLQAAVDAACRANAAAARVVVWGLCDAASAAMMFTTGDPRVTGLVVANPWVRSEATLAATHVKYYYTARIVQREFWSKLFRGGIDWRQSLHSFVLALRRARRSGATATKDAGSPSFQTEMARGLDRFRGRVLLILSGNDLTAKEFLQYTDSNTAWKNLLADPKVRRVDLPEADHTFSSRAWMHAVERETGEWIASLGSAPASDAPRCRVS